MNAAFVHAMAAFDPWEAHPRLAIAVSGGGDSMALLLLADSWARERGGEVLALTVDHRLRPESSAEAEQVAAWCAARNIAHHTLTWEHGDISGNLMAAAREARYRLLAEACVKEGILHLLIAHHQQDQAETHAMREARGLDATGLAAMPTQREESWGRILRPLLEVGKEVLQSFLTAQGQPWLEDLTNQNPAYERTLVRQALTPEDVASHADAAQKAGRERRKMEHETAAALVECVMFHPWGQAALTKSIWLSQDESIRLKALDAILRVCGGQREGPRRTELQRLADAMRDEGWNGSGLHGCLLFPSARKGQEDQIVICRDPAWVAAPLNVLPGGQGMWDGRFQVCNDTAHSLRVFSYAQEKVTQSLPEWCAALPARVRDGLPVARLEDGKNQPYVFLEGSLKEPGVPLGVSLTFCPPKPLAGPLFCGTLEA